MIIVPLGHHSGELERLTCRHWCEQNLGPEDPNKWFFVEAAGNTSDNILLARSLRNAGCIHSLVFYKSEDATAFKLRFGL